MSCSKYDEIAEVYDSFFNDEESLLENNQVADMLSDVKGRVYDIGCGTGLLTELIKVAPINYYGVDPSYAMLDKFMEKHDSYRHRVVQDDFEHDAVDLNRFDWVVSLFGSISYVEPKSLSRIAESSAKYFLMFYRSDYFPVTYSLAGVDFPHYRYEKEDLMNIFKNSSIVEFNNYIIVSR